MSSTPTYPDGSAIAYGDAVLLKEGGPHARVTQVIETAEQMAAYNVEAPGVVVDVQRSGVVFLSAELLKQDPLVFVARGASESVNFQVTFALCLAVFLLLPAVWSFFSAIVSAVTTGEVLVISIHRYEMARELVPWQAGWARFVAPPLLLASLLLTSFGQRSRRLWWTAASLAALGSTLLLFSLWFSSEHGFIIFFALNLFIGLAHYLDQKLGRAAVYPLLFIGVVWFVYNVA